MIGRVSENMKRLARRAAERPPVAEVLGLFAGLAVSLAALVGFTELVEEVFTGESRRFDRAVLIWINATFPAWLDGPMRVVTALGYYWVVIPLALLSAYGFYSRGLEISAVLILVSAGGAAVLATVLKSIFQRSRPELFDSGYTASFYSFPSGHATIAVAFYGTLALLVAIRLQGWRRWGVTVAGVAVVVLIGFSRLYLGVHYPTDIIAGYLAAAIWTGAVGAVLVYRELLHDLREWRTENHRVK